MNMSQTADANGFTEIPAQSHFEYDTREDAVTVATRMMRDGWDVRIIGTVVTVDKAPVSVFAVYAGVCGLEY